MTMSEIKFEYGFESVNGIVKKVYWLSEIPNIKEKCDVWNDLPMKYVRQFTGLKDNKGKNIFDGDIVTYDGTPFLVNALKATGVIVNYKGSWALKYKSDYKTSDGLDYYNYYLFSCEDFFDRKSTVIGNIHENADLLL
jgi:uncharacterized phage protein (TIGR01671 family)